MTGARAAKIVFLVELILLALPAMIFFATSFAALGGLTTYASPAPEGSPPFSEHYALIAFGLFALAFTSFAVLAVRYLFGGGEGVARVTPIVWALAIAGQAIALPAALWTALAEDAPNEVRGLALLTFPALGLLIPLVHMAVAASLARRERSGASSA